MAKDPNTILEQEHQFFQGQEAVSPSLGPVVGFVAPRSNPGLESRWAGSLCSSYHSWLSDRQACPAPAPPCVKQGEKQFTELCSCSRPGRARGLSPRGPQRRLPHAASPHTFWGQNPGQKLRFWRVYREVMAPSSDSKGEEGGCPSRLPSSSESEW